MRIVLKCTCNSCLPNQLPEHILNSFKQYNGAIGSLIKQNLKTKCQNDQIYKIEYREHCESMLAGKGAQCSLNTNLSRRNTQS